MFVGAHACVMLTLMARAVVAARSAGRPLVSAVRVLPTRPHQTNFWGESANCW